MYHEIYLHVVWTTRDRKATIDQSRAAYLAEQLDILARQERCRLVEIGIVSTHLHLLLRAHPTVLLPRMIQRMKGGTAHGINRGSASSSTHLRWAKGYGIKSVSPRALGRVAAYVRAQPVRHPTEAITGWSGAAVASATSAEPRH